MEGGREEIDRYRDRGAGRKEEGRVNKGRGGGRRGKGR